MSVKYSKKTLATYLKKEFSIKVFSINLMVFIAILAGCANTSYSDSADSIWAHRQLERDPDWEYFKKSYERSGTGFYRDGKKIKLKIGINELNECVRRLEATKVKPRSKKKGTKELYACLENKGIVILIEEIVFA